MKCMWVKVWKVYPALPIIAWNALERAEGTAQGLAHAPYPLFPPFWCPARPAWPVMCARPAMCVQALAAPTPGPLAWLALTPSWPRRASTRTTTTLRVPSKHFCHCLPRTPPTWTRWSRCEHAGRRACRQAAVRSHAFGRRLVHAASRELLFRCFGFGRAPTLPACCTAVRSSVHSRRAAGWMGGWGAEGGLQRAHHVSSGSGTTE